MVDDDPVHPEVIAWVRREVCGPGRLEVDSLSQSGAGGPWMLRPADRPSIVIHVGDAQDAEARQGFRTQVAALRLAERHQLLAPRVLGADLTGAATGHLVLCSSALPGSSRIPDRLDAAQLRAHGAAIARIHQVPAQASDDLPVRNRSLDGLHLGAPPPGPTAALFDAATEALDRQATAPPTAGNLVHGDLWLGNTLWEDGELRGTIDWDFAGVGHGGIDLGSARCDAAIMYGVEAADLVLAGWEAVWGSPADDVAHWDLVAATSSPPDLSHWLPNFHAQGRGDLDLATVTTRRDSFLRHALSRAA